MAQARVQMRPDVVTADGRYRGQPTLHAVETGCEACNGSGEVWLMDRHAGAVWMRCGCGAARDGGASASWLAIICYPCAAFGICASVLFLL